MIDDYQYTYDGAGNRLTQTVNGTTTTYTYNNANELTAADSITYSYDANGNLTGNSAGLSLSYNALNQTASITPPGGTAIGMSYAGDSQVERVAAGSRSFTNSALGLSLAVDGSGTTAYIRDNQGKLTEQRTPSGNYYYLFDGLGSVVALTDSSGAVVNTYSYDPYGNTKSSTGTVDNPWRFGGSYGAYHDADTGLYKIGMRYYSPELGRWTQQDPMVHLFDPVQLNRYAYAGCNPSNISDPSGMAFTGCSFIFLVVGIGVNVGMYFWMPMTGGASLIVGILFGASLWVLESRFC
ncbi:RHS repeat-associated core domain-containing protein [Nitrolancea hollandica]|uniref:YD repeat protein n=1 Tax=Nitrolancea hollandica Lb TaxID=1129897 RepID=I4EKE3_9BACT